MWNIWLVWLGCNGTDKKHGSDLKNLIESYQNWLLVYSTSFFSDRWKENGIFFSFALSLSLVRCLLGIMKDTFYSIIPIKKMWTTQSHWLISFLFFWFNILISTEFRWLDFGWCCVSVFNHTLINFKSMINVKYDHFIYEISSENRKYPFRAYRIFERGVLSNAFKMLVLRCCFLIRTYSVDRII